MEHIKRLSLKERIVKNNANVTHSHPDFFIGELQCQPQIVHPFIINDYGCCLCLSGEARGTIDLVPCHLRPMTMAVNIPGQLLKQHSMSGDFRGIVIVMSRKFVQELGLPYNFKLDQMLRESPCTMLNEAQHDAIISFFTMAKKLLQVERPYQAESLRHLICAFFYGIGSYLYELTDNRQYSSGELLMQRFLAEVKEHHKREHKVGFYADKLNITSGYLFTVVKRVSGKSPGEWIDDFIVGEARAMLKGSTLTIKQICYELGFPSQSFFGKFFKRITGMSPKDYRHNSTTVN